MEDDNKNIKYPFPITLYYNITGITDYEYTYLMCNILNKMRGIK